MIIEEHARLELFLPDGRTFEIPESDIIQNSLSVTSQCVNGNTFGFGCVSPAQLSVKIRIKDQNIGRYDVYGGAIILYSWFGEHPPEDGGKRGVFNVTTVAKKDDIFTISASDNICLLDNSAFNSSQNVIFERFGRGNGIFDAYNAIKVVAGEFAIDFHGNLLKPNFKDNPNVTEIPNADKRFDAYEIPEYFWDVKVDFSENRHISIYSDEQSDNIRDYVSWLAEYMGGFVQADANGNPQFCLFENIWKNGSHSKILDFSEFEQNSLEIAGFRVYLYSAKVILEDRQWRYCDTGKNTENGVINTEIVIQNNPFVEYSYKYFKADMMPIVASLAFYQRYIQIRPFSGTYHGKEYLHLGQYIQITDKDGTSYGTTITNMTWKFRGGQQIRCVGEDSRTLSQARKRSQAIRMGERLKTQINRTESNLRTEMGNMSGNMKDISENQTDQWNAIQDQQDQINALWNALNGG
ncbi:MAG: hypothetical protein K2H29_09620 [Oscillospiraceae bacterium]|nr:hypothetical protein [Oscillospiraceae bacterium]